MRRVRQGQLLRGRRPCLGSRLEGPTRDDPLLLRFSSQLMLAILALLATRLGWSLWELRQRRQRCGRRAGSRHQDLAVALPLVVDLAVLAFAWLYLPAHYGITGSAISRGTPA